MDEIAKYFTDQIERTLKNYGRKVVRLGDHALEVAAKPYEALSKTRVLVRRTGTIEIERLDSEEVPNLEEHIKDALAGEYTLAKGPRGAGKVSMLKPRALPGATMALPAGRDD